MFIDDPQADKFDKNGKFISDYSKSRFVCIGKQMTIEEAMAMHQRDTNKENTWGKPRSNSIRHKVI